MLCPYVERDKKKNYVKKQAELKKKYDIKYPQCLENGGRELLDDAKKAKKQRMAESEEEDGEEEDK